MSSWYSDPWTQDDSVLGGLPYTVAPPPAYSIEGVKTVWNWSPHVLGGLPYTVWMPPESAGIYVELPSGKKSLGSFPSITVDKRNFIVGANDRANFRIKKK